MINRKKTRQIKIGNIKIGGPAPISIQSMTKTKTSDVKATIREIKKLEKYGCEIIRVAVKNEDDANAIKKIKNGINIPLVCDIHFNYRLALKAIENGADKIRLNPGNIRKEEDIAAVVKAAKRARIPIRIGVNSGSADVGKSKIENRKWKNKNPSSIFHSLSSNIANSALHYIRLFEELDFHDIIISVKASDVLTTIAAYRQMSGVCDYPLHLGVTASGPYDYGVVKSSLGIGALLLDGIGDTIRVSLTADPVEEVICGKRILSSLGIRKFGPEIISCPTCGRCQVDLMKVVNELEEKLSTIGYGLSIQSFPTVAIMGCEVNGPGEAKAADIGIAFGKASGIIFKNGKIIKKVTLKNSVNELLKLISNN